MNGRKQDGTVNALFSGVKEQLSEGLLGKEFTLGNTSHQLEEMCRALELLEVMLLIRAFDSSLPDLYTRGLMRGSSHAALGQEAVAAGACKALSRDDVIASTHRGHGHAIAKGANIDKMMAELFGKVEGCCRGKGGSMHVAEFDIGMLGANGVVAGGVGLAAGAALASTLKGDNSVAVSFFGDGALNQGVLHEVMNLAAIWQLPIVFVCENNQFAMSAPASEMVAGKELERRADAYGMPGERVDGMNALEVYEAASALAHRAREGEGPSLLVADCYRFEGHFSGDSLSYRDEAEFQVWKERDPIEQLGNWLISAGVLTSNALSDGRALAETVIQDAVDAAMLAKAPSRADALRDVYA